MTERGAARAAVFVVMATAFLVVLTAYLVPRTVALRIFGQDGPVEIAELTLYGVAAWLVLRDRGLGPVARMWSLVALGLLVTFEVNPGGFLEGIVQIAPDHPGDPVGMRWGGVAAVALLGGIVIAGLLISHRRTFFPTLRSGAVEAWLTLVGMALVPAAFAVDRYHETHFVWNRGYRLVQGVAFASHIAEETAELLVPLCFVLALWLRGRRVRSGIRKDG